LPAPLIFGLLSLNCLLSRHAIRIYGLHCKKVPQNSDRLHRDIIRRMENMPVSPEQTLGAPEKDPSEIVVFKRNHFYAIMVVFSFAVGILVGYVAWGRGATTQQAAAQAAGAQAADPTANPAYTRYDIPTEGFPSLGPDDAPITLVEFSDYQCPFCKRWHDETYQQLLAAYPGQIRMVYRQLPLTSLHPDAMSAAIASLCANDQGAFWQFHDKLFSDEYGLGRDAYVKYATDLELDTAAFKTCLDSGKFDDFIQKDMAFSLNLGVQSTPTFFINGLAVVGAQPLSVFKQVIDKELAGEIPQ
jgi:protein-disulfide isomerase